MDPPIQNDCHLWVNNDFLKLRIERHTNLLLTASVTN